MLTKFSNEVALRNKPLNLRVEILTDWSTCQFNTAQLIFDDSKGQSEIRLKKREKVSEKKYSLTGIGGFYPI